MIYRDGHAQQLGERIGDCSRVSALGYNLRRKLGYTGAVKSKIQMRSILWRRVDCAPPLLNPAISCSIYDFSSCFKILHPLPCHRFDAKTRGGSPVRYWTGSIRLSPQ
jgi:hypothetical protein